MASSIPHPDFAHPHASAAPVVTDEERTWALFVHLSHLVFLFTGIPVVAPLILWLIKKDQSVYIDDHGREAVNFSISLVLWSIISMIIAFVVGMVTCGIGFVIGLVPWVLGVIGTIMGAVAANRGEYFRYPMCWRFIH